MLEDQLFGADLHALAAAGALIVINPSHKVVDLDGALGAGLFAPHAADAAEVALLVGNGALFVVGAHHHRLIRRVVHPDDLLRAGILTGAAAGAF